MGDKNGFLRARLKNYSSDRNIPLKPKALSGLSPYLHFGQISAQRCALEAQKVRKLYPQVRSMISLMFIFIQFELPVIVLELLLDFGVSSEIHNIIFLNLTQFLWLLF